MAESGWNLAADARDRQRNCRFWRGCAGIPREDDSGEGSEAVREENAERLKC